MSSSQQSPLLSRPRSFSLFRADKGKAALQSQSQLRRWETRTDKNVEALAVWPRQ
ncbi:hypothetical protein HYPSUDRAFT_200950 [Hypholoma sublateritium FD-334 SS-4]|uniref:Uncharacterized protein n=1 Tax=Hypholoma sublateritium (strain FD-334 SS-4) TaxID=945553 RepID=A0A0D2NYK8_HYPSF|nr:hypothetical protein HYPSUDRAFT_200950 [Hypholoma sublateritium FD-334 SS-4]